MDGCLQVLQVVFRTWETVCIFWSSFMGHQVQKSKMGWIMHVLDWKLKGRYLEN